MHDPAELEAVAAPALVETLDLALSITDRRAHALDDEAPPPETDGCASLDLLVVAERFTGVRTLRISGCEAAVHGGLDAFSRVEHLTLADIALDGVTMARIGELTRLDALELIRVRATEDPTRPLTSPARLTRLTLRDLEPDSTLGDLLGDLPDLRSVTLEGRWAGHRAMLSLSKASHLRELVLLDTEVGNFSLNQIRGLTELERVRWVGDAFNDNTPLYLRDLPVVEFVCDCPRLGDRGIRHLRYSKGLRRVVLERSRATPEGLAELAELPALEHLELRGVDVDTNALTPLASLPSLRTLILTDGALVDPTAKGLGDLQSVRALTVQLRGLGDPAAPELGRLVGLETLELGHSELSDAGLASLVTLTALRELSLHHTRVTAKGLEALRAMPELEVLELDHTDVVDAGVEQLRDATSLRELRLDHTLVTDASIDHLLTMESLESLNLAHTVVTRDAARRLGALPRLRAINLEAIRD